jgi:hypothetical protein
MIDCCIDIHMFVCGGICVFIHVHVSGRSRARGRYEIRLLPALIYTCICECMYACVSAQMPNKMLPKIAQMFAVFKPPLAKHTDILCYIK